jgi:hypothetical protein
VLLKRPLGSRLRLSAVVAALTALVPRQAVADDGSPKYECIAADTDGQTLRLAGSLFAARRRFGACAKDACPEMVRDDCRERIAEIARVQPTIVFEATNGHGHALRLVKVFEDGALVATRLDGQAFSVDPGEHVFKFKALGRITAEMRIIIEEGRNDRHGVVLRTASVDSPDFVPAPALEGDDGAPSTNSTRQEKIAQPRTSRGHAPAAPPGLLDSDNRKLALVVGGAGLIGVAVGSAFGLTTISSWDAAQRDCGASCAPDSAGPREQANARKAGSIATFSFFAGGVALAGGAVLWFTAPTVGSASSVGVTVVPAVGRPGGTLSLRGRF